MLSCPVQKDIGEYEEKLIAGLTMRTTVGIASGLVLASAIGCFGYFVLGVSVSDLSLPILAIVVVSFLAGYYKPYGLKFEEAVPIWAADHLGPSVLTYRSSLDLFLDERGREEAKRPKTKEQKEAVKERERARDEYEDLKDEYKDLCPELLFSQWADEKAKIYDAV